MTDNQMRAEEARLIRKIQWYGRAIRLFIWLLVAAWIICPLVPVI